jgi:two-component system chemotaxis sensor kinase CheA
MDSEFMNAGDDSAESIIEELRKTFKEEAHELLAELEHALLDLEKAPGDKEQIGRVFRVVHTLKGSSGACEFHDIVAFTHELESMLDTVRSGEAEVTKEIINLTLSAQDQLRSLFNRYYQGETADDAKSEEILTSFKKNLEKVKVQGPAPLSEQHAAQKGPHQRRVTYRIRFRPHTDSSLLETNALDLLTRLHELGECNVIAQTDAVPYLEDLDPISSHLYWDIILTTSRSLDAIQGVFIFVKDKCELKIDVIDEEGCADDKRAYKKLGDILLERGDLAPDDLEKVLKGKKLVGEMLIENGFVSRAKVESALIEQQHVREMREQRPGDSHSSVRVATDKLDKLVNLVGELVTVQARLSRTAADTEMPVLLSIAEEVERLSDSLRENAMNIRMLPIGTTFNRFQRLVRDLSANLGKEIEMTTDGAETELDKTVIEQLSDPLVHIIRNSIGHGIEQPEAREAAGKPRKGTIHLSAVHSGAHVLIRIKDDGAGLDLEAIRARAVGKGLLDQSAVPTERELHSFIFAAGFSTAEKVTGVSGRGVGLDVVKKTIETLGGSIELVSRRGTGTTITLKLPLTLAIIDGLLVTIGDQYYIIPISFVRECIDLTEEDRKKSHSRQITNVRGDLVPYINLREHFKIPGGPSAVDEQIVITETDGRCVGFVVDTVIGGHQTVIKNLGTYYRNLEGVSGATILGDGTVALVLDVPRLACRAERDEVAVCRDG